MKLTRSVSSAFKTSICMLLLFGTAQSQANSDAYVNEAVDVNPDPRIFETTIVAAPMQMTLNSGEEVTVFAYNGQVPGPEISVNQGDRVIVHFENNLPEEYPSTIHWHGIELNNASDGTPMTQAPVPAGGSYTYDFIVPRGGIFWYHPHVRGSQVVNAGLYGSLIVKQDVEKELVNENILPKRDRTLVFSTMAVEDGELKDIEGEPVLATMNGNEGNHLLVNGLENPTINAKVGEPLRLRLINTSITRYFRVSIPGHTIYRVGGEGGLLSNVRVEGGSIMGMRMAMPMDMMDDDMDMGDGSMDMGDGGMDMGDGGMDMPVYTGYEGPIMIDQGYDKGEILLTPAQRADIVIIPQGEVGDTITVQWKDFARGRHQMVMTPMGMMMTEADDDGLRPSIDLFNIKLKKSQNNTTAYSINEGDALVANAGRLDIDRMDSEIKLQANMMAMMSGMPKSTWFMIDDFNGVEGRTNYRTATVGETLKHEVHNHTDMHHPFHLHGFSFQPTMFMTMNHDEGYMDMWTVNPENEYIDTVNIPPHTSAFYLFDVPERPDYGAEAGTTLGDGSVGDWVFHCHILQHGENGMMSFLRVTR